MEKKRMNTETVISEAKLRLNATGIYTEEEYGPYILQMFDSSTHYDMALRIKIINQSARLYTHERGECIYEYITQNIEDAVFYILYDIIRIIIERIIWDKYVDDNQCLNYNDDINNERKRLSCEAFEKIGGNYEKWYRGGRIPFKNNIT